MKYKQQQQYYCIIYKTSSKAIKKDIYSNIYKLYSFIYYQNRMLNCLPLVLYSSYSVCIKQNITIWQAQYHLIYHCQQQAEYCNNIICIIFLPGLTMGMVQDSLIIVQESMKTLVAEYKTHGQTDRLAFFVECQSSRLQSQQQNLLKWMGYSRPRHEANKPNHNIVNNRFAEAQVW